MGIDVKKNASCSSRPAVEGDKGAKILEKARDGGTHKQELRSQICLSTSFPLFYQEQEKPKGCRSQAKNKRHGTSTNKPGKHNLMAHNEATKSENTHTFIFVVANLHDVT